MAGSEPDGFTACAAVPAQIPCGSSFSISLCFIASRKFARFLISESHSTILPWPRLSVHVHKKRRRPAPRVIEGTPETILLLAFFL
jgi:hypothetical protein